MRRACQYIQRRGWEVTLLTEVRSETFGTMWLGDEISRMAVMHSKTTGIAIQGKALRSWVQDGQRVEHGERTTTIITEQMKISGYQPLWSNGEERIEDFRRELENQLAKTKKKEILIIGGDFNAQIGRDSRDGEVCGSFGLRTATNEAGRDLLDWCGSENLVYANSFCGHRKRGTWFNRPHRRWYELDGFILRRDQRHSMVKKMKTIHDMAISDHNPKEMTIRIRRRRMRQIPRTKKPPIGWEKLQEENTREMYREATALKLQESEEEIQEGGENWKLVSEVMVSAAEEVCGRSRTVDNPWTVGREDQLRALHDTISRSVQRRNTAEETRLTRANAAAITEERRQAKEQLRDARKNMKIRLRQWETEWWEDIITQSQCETACQQGRMGEMYRIFRKLGTRGNLTQNAIQISAADFKEHFSSVSEKCYKREPEQIEEALEIVLDLRENDEAKEWNDMLNQRPEEEEIVAEMKNVKDSAPGRDEVRMRYINSADAEIRRLVIETVQHMFTTRAQRWDESLKTGIMIPIHKKGPRDDTKN